MGLLILRGYVDHEVHCSVAAAKFVSMPGNELDEVVVEGAANPSFAGRKANALWGPLSPS